MSMRTRPTHPLSQLRHEMDRLISGLLPDGGERPWMPMRPQPAVNLWEDLDRVYVELEVPGVKSEQLDLSVVGSQLTLKLERPEAIAEGVTYHRRERPVGTFVRVVDLPADVDPTQVEAELHHGVLTVRLAKAEAAKPRKIQVSNGK